MNIYESMNDGIFKWIIYECLNPDNLNGSKWNKESNLQMQLFHPSTNPPRDPWPALSWIRLATLGLGFQGSDDPNTWLSPTFEEENIGKKQHSIHYIHWHLIMSPSFSWPLAIGHFYGAEKIWLVQSSTASCPNRSSAGSTDPSILIIQILGSDGKLTWDWTV